MSVLPSSRKLFADGWGLSQDALAEHFQSAVDPAILSQTPPLTIRWGPWSSGEKGVRCREGTYAGPVKDLPEPLTTGRILDVRPSDSGPSSGESISRESVEDGEERVPRRCLLFGAWSDEGWRKRFRIAQRLASRGVATVIHETPFHGSRRIYEGGSPIRRVDEHALLTRMTAVEGVALLKALSPGTDRWVVAGFSMGASHAGAVLALSGEPLAGALFAVGYSPSIPFIDGVLRKYVAWSALGGRDTAEEQLRELLGSISLLRLEKPVSPDRILLVGARGDAFIPRWAVEGLADAWRGTRVQWRPGGHGSLYLFERDFMAQTIVDQF